MSHWAILPIVVPLMFGAGLVLLRGFSIEMRRTFAAMAVLLALALGLRLGTETVDGTVLAYLLGNWRAPFGIALAADRLTVVMLLLSSLAALLCLVAATDNDADDHAPHFHALLCFQLMGLNGAFLTADLFNLFVFFEVLLISSYALLLHGADGKRVRAATHYVVVNLTGSALFLIAVSLLYGITGTLNMADLAQRLAALPDADRTLAASASLMLLVVFALKAALLPLYLWLPGTYRQASAPVAALFAIMTKVGVYAIARVFCLLGNTDAGSAGLVGPWHFWLGLATILGGSVGAIAARDLRSLAAALTIVSAGMLLAILGVDRAPSVGAALYYLAHSTLIGAALFLVASLVARARPHAADRLQVAEPIVHGAWLGGLFALVAIAAASLPPLSGFIAKIGLLTHAGTGAARAAVWAVILISGLLVLIAVARAASILFWRPLEGQNAETGSATSSAAAPAQSALRSLPATALSVAAALLGSVVLTLYAGPLQRYLDAAAVALYQPSRYVAAVMTAAPADQPPAASRMQRARTSMVAEQTP
jgi:multicomponent K+:H+ antiporter subunit D